MRKKTSNSQSVQKNKKKCAINGKERHITQNKPSRHAKLNKQYEKHRFKAEKNKTQQTTFNGRKKYKNGHQQ